MEVPLFNPRTVKSSPRDGGPVLPFVWPFVVAKGMIVWGVKKRHDIRV